MSAQPVLKPTIVLADDNNEILKKVSRLLRAEFNILASALNGRAAMSLALELQPDVLVLDVSMPVLDGFQVCTLLKLTTLNTKVIFLTTYSDTPMIQAAFRAGGRAVVFKPCMQTDLPIAIAEVLAGRTFLSSIESQ